MKIVKLSPQLSQYFKISAKIAYSLDLFFLLSLLEENSLLLLFRLAFILSLYTLHSHTHCAHKYNQLKKFFFLSYFVLFIHITYIHICMHKHSSERRELDKECIYGERKREKEREHLFSCKFWHAFVMTSNSSNIFLTAGPLSKWPFIHSFVYIHTFI